MRIPCGELERAARIGPEAQGMDITEAFALLAALELRDIEDLDDAYFEAELQELLPPA